MGENEKLGFTCEEVPFDFSTFNRFFGATTDWVDEGGSVVPKVPRDNLYPPMSPSPLKEDTQVWNGSKLLDVGEFIAPKGIEQRLDTINKEILLSNLVGRSVAGELPNWIIQYEDGKCYAYNVKTHEKHLVRSPCTHKPRKKHYKPKFTL